MFLKAANLNLVLMSILLSNLAWATLGESDVSIENEARDLSAVHAKRQRSLGPVSYTVHTMTSPTLTVTEYVDSNNMVFAVKWQGSRRPDLKTLLGTHFEEYQSELDRQPLKQGRHSNTVHTKSLFVHGGGHMRDLRGTAYLPGRVPEGVSVESLP